MEHLRLSDRSSLLSEIQALRAQLRLTHLQNQEKLQQLCAALTSAEARGSQQEHQLRRQGGCGPSAPPQAHVPHAPLSGERQAGGRACAGQGRGLRRVPGAGRWGCGGSSVLTPRDRIYRGHRSLNEA